jgi:hypothetical protein
VPAKTEVLAWIRLLGEPILTVAGQRRISNPDEYTGPVTGLHSNVFARDINLI